MDSDALYWTSTCDGGSIQAAAKADWSIATLATSTGALADVVIDDNSIYVSGNAQILRIPKSGGALAGFVSNVATPVQMLVDDSSLYWSDNNRRVFIAPKDGASPPRQVGTGGFIGKSLQDSTSVYWIDLDGVYQLDKATLQADYVFSNVPGFDRTMAVAAGHAYLWATEFSGPTGSSTESVVTVYELPDPIAHYYGDSFHAAVADSESIYWIKGDTLVRRSAAGGGSEDIAAVTPFYGVGLVIDDQYVYWYDESTEVISRVRK